MKRVLFVVGLALPLLGGVSLAADFDGDGTNDIGIFRPVSSLWAVRGITRVYFGSSNDNPIPGDYNGDGTADIGLFRATSGLWAVRGVTRAYFGSPGDEPLGGSGGGGGGLPTTGQATSYRTGDDGTYQAGHNVLVDNSDGTVTDSRTGLMWPKDGTGAGYWNGQTATWNEAIDWANNLDFAGHADWRLPNINELKRFQEVTWGHYQNQPTYYYWSSTTCSDSTLSALNVNFMSGMVDFEDNKTKGYYVVAVRGGL
ncbi:MAG: DUF1566 domain-containing protein [Candidatus Auribacterota bacterium]|nr:DUF1566 domain-containing protein [Candidatus Auribacterota bacterium]